MFSLGKEKETNEDKGCLYPILARTLARECYLRSRNSATPYKVCLRLCSSWTYYPHSYTLSCGPVFSNKEGEAALFIVTHMSKKNIVHRTKVGNNEELKMMIGTREENGLTMDLSWCALSEFIMSSSLC